MGLCPAVDFLCLAILLLFALQRGLETFLNEPLAQPFNRGRMDVERLFDLLVGPVFAVRPLVRLQQHPGVPLLVGSRLPLGDQGTQIRSLLSRRGDDLYLLGQCRAPFLTKGATGKDTAILAKALVSVSGNATLTVN